MSKVICFGEIMLRLSPPGYQRFEQAGSFDIIYGGGEANVAVSLAGFGIDTAFITKVPDNPIGQSALNELRRYGVETQNILRGGDRLGVYYLEKGASQRPSKVVYDRGHSSVSEADPSEYNWEDIFAGSSWFHFTGITPALGEHARAALLEGCKCAKSLGVKISCDLNYRKNLWSTEEANKTMSELMDFVDICIANEEDAEKVFGIRAEGTDVTEGMLNYSGYKDVARKLADEFNFTKVAITLRESLSANDNNWAAMLYDGDEYHFSEKYPVHIVDRVGGGDSFAAGLIYGELSGMSSGDALEFAVAASCLKHSIEGDANHVSVSEVKSLMQGNSSGRVIR